MKIGRSLQVMNSKEVKHLMQMLDDQFGIAKKLDFVFLLNSKEKVYIVNRAIESLDLNSLSIDSAGLYLGTFQSDGFRPSIEGSQILGKLATKNIVELTQLKKHSWMKGENIDVDGEQSRIVLVKSGDDFLGSGKIKEGAIINSVPKGRRLKTVNESLS